MGLLLEISADFAVSVAAAGLLISGYALGVVVGARDHLGDKGNRVMAAALDLKTLLGR